MTTKQVQEFKETEIGKIPVDWEVKELGEITLMITDGKHGDCENQQNSGYYFLSAKDVIDGQLQYHSARQITKNDFEEVNKRTRLEAGDILITNSGTIGRLAIAEDQEKTKKTTFQKSVAIVRPKKTILNNLFLYYYFSFSNNILSQTIAGGTSQPNLLLGDLRSFKISLPNLEYQISLSTFLHSFDLQINSLKHQNKILEQTAQAIFKSRFVDFDGVTEFEDSELGQIPKGWSVDTLDSIGKIITGKTPSTKEKDNFGNDYPFITIPDMQNSIWAVKIERGISEKGKTKIQKYLLPENSVCVSCIATPGLVILTTQNSFTNQQINSIICKQRISPFFIFLAMKMQKENIIELGSGGTATLNLNKNNFSLIKIVLPPSNLISDFHNSISPIFEIIKRNSFTIESLTKTRDALLPKLMSGEIRV